MIQLGGLHISMCFLKVIGKHMNSSGLLEAWVESGLLGLNASVHVMAYKRAMRTHKITLQTLWKLLLPQMLTFYQMFYQQLYREISPFTSSTESAVELITSLKSSVAQNALDDFVKQKS